MKVLLTGGSGMVGRNLLEHAEAANVELLHPSRQELDLRDRRLSANLSYAERARIPIVAIYGDAERDAGQVVLRDLAARTEQRPALTALPTPPTDY